MKMETVIEATSYTFHKNYQHKPIKHINLCLANSMHAIHVSNNYNSKKHRSHVL